MINGKRLNHLRFADDIVILANDKELSDLNNLSKQISLRMSYAKPQSMTNESSTTDPELRVGNKIIKKVKSYIYFVQMFQISQKNLPWICQDEYHGHKPHMGDFKNFQFQ